MKFTASWWHTGIGGRHRQHETCDTVDEARKVLALNMSYSRDVEPISVVDSNGGSWPFDIVDEMQKLTDDDFWEYGLEPPGPIT